MQHVHAVGNTKKALCIRSARSGVHGKVGRNQSWLCCAGCWVLMVVFVAFGVVNGGLLVSVCGIVRSINFAGRMVSNTLSETPTVSQYCAVIFLHVAVKSMATEQLYYKQLRLY